MYAQNLSACITHWYKKVWRHSDVNCCWNNIPRLYQGIKRCILQCEFHLYIHILGGPITFHICILVGRHYTQITYIHAYIHTFYEVTSSIYLYHFSRTSYDYKQLGFATYTYFHTSSSPSPPPPPPPPPPRYIIKRSLPINLKSMYLVLRLFVR